MISEKAMLLLIYIFLRLSLFVIWNNLNNLSVQISFSLHLVGMWFLHQRFYKHFQFCSARRWRNYLDFLLHAYRNSYLHANCAGVFALININFSTMDFVPSRAWDSSCVRCFSRYSRAIHAAIFPFLSLEMSRSSEVPFIIEEVGRRTRHSRNLESSDYKGEKIFLSCHPIIIPF